MGKPKEYYYGDIKKWLMQRDTLPTDREQVERFQGAVTESLIETANLPNGELRIKAIEMVLFKKTHTYVGVAQVVHYDWRTVQNWITAFVNLVGKKAGF